MRKDLDNNEQLEGQTDIFDFIDVPAEEPAPAAQKPIKINTRSADFIQSLVDAEQAGLATVNEWNIGDEKAQELKEKIRNYLTQKQQEVNELYETAEQNLQELIESDLFNELNETIYNATDDFTSFYNSDYWLDWDSAVSDGDDQLIEGAYPLDFLQLGVMARYILDNWKYLKPTIEQYKANHKKKYITLQELAGTRKDDTLAPLYSEEFKQLLKENTEKINQQDVEFTQQELQALERNSRKKLETIKHPIDKVNNTVWKQLAQHKVGKQLEIDLARAGSEIAVNAIFSIDFEEMETHITYSKKLTSFDKRVYTVISNLYQENSNIVSATQISKFLLGGDSKAQIDRVKASIDKMRFAKLTLSNLQEKEASYNYPLFEYEDYLLPASKLTMPQTGDTYYKVKELPPLFKFAQERKQLTTIKASTYLLTGVVSNTDVNIDIAEYLTDRIRLSAKGKGDKILLESLYQETGLKGKQRTRALEPIKKILLHLVKQGELDRCYITAKEIMLHQEPPRGVVCDYITLEGIVKHPPKKCPKGTEKLSQTTEKLSQTTEKLSKGKPAKH